MTNNGNVFYFYRGRVALYALLRALGVGPGDEVIIQAFTCLAVPVPVLALGARPIYTDIDPATYGMNPQQLPSCISGHTKAIVVQHTFGIPADLDAIVLLARKHGVAIIEDCCHSLGSTYRGRELGSFGDAAFFSYEWGKPLTIGLGGSALVNSEELRVRLQAQYSEYRVPSAAELLLIDLQYYAHRLIYRPSLFWPVKDLYHNLSAYGLLIGNFRAVEFDGKASADYRKCLSPRLRRRLSAIAGRSAPGIRRRKTIARQYDALMQKLGLAGLKLPSHCDPVLLRYPLLTTDKAAVLAAARHLRVEAGEFFRTPVDPLAEGQWPIAGYDKNSCPVAEAISQRIVTLPVTDRPGDEDMNTILGFVEQMAGRGWLRPSLGLG